MNDNEPTGAMTEEQWQIARDYLKSIGTEICPFCLKDLQGKEQRGRCVYAVPCGHRMYQGTIREKRWDTKKPG